MRLGRRGALACALAILVAAECAAQTPMTWPEVSARFRAASPTLQAGQIGIDESRADETTAFLRPNPQLSLSLDQLNPVPSGDAGIFTNRVLLTSASYLHERQQKRELRRDSARGATGMAVASQADLERTLLFGLRAAFVQVLQAKAFRALAAENLAGYDQVLELSRARLAAGDIAQVDLDRLALQRVTFESDAATAAVNLRTAKIQLLRLLNDRTTPIDAFDVDGPFEAAAVPPSVEDLHRMAFDLRPDLQAALLGAEKAKTDHQLALANGSADPVLGVDVAVPQSANFTPGMGQYVGASVSVPLRIFDRNQGEKLRTQLDIARNEQLAAAARAQVIGDVDTAYAALASAADLIRPYKDTYLGQAARVHDTVTFAYERGGASLVEFLQAQQEHRAIQIGYVNLVAAFLNAANQLNLAVGREVIQ